MITQNMNSKVIKYGNQIKTNDLQNKTEAISKM